MNANISRVTDLKKRMALILFGALIAYGVWNARNLILGPQIEILEPIAGNTLESNSVFIKGIVRNASFISLNGRQIFTDNQGIFAEEILPAYGYNIGEIVAQDRFGKKKRESITFYYNKQITRRETATTTLPQPEDGQTE